MRDGVWQRLGGLGPPLYLYLLAVDVGTSWSPPWLSFHVNKVGTLQVMGFGHVPDVPSTTCQRLGKNTPACREFTFYPRTNVTKKVIDIRGLGATGEMKVGAGQTGSGDGIRWGVGGAGRPQTWRL